MHPHNQALLRALRTVPETRLHLFELAWELADKAASHAGELQDALSQAAAYAKGVKNLQVALLKLLPRQ